jgi:hypothetical protein
LLPYCYLLNVLLQSYLFTCEKSRHIIVFSTFQFIFFELCLVLALNNIYFAAELMLNHLITSSMATKNWNNDFMAKVLEEAAWKELSSEFA